MQIKVGKVDEEGIGRPRVAWWSDHAARTHGCAGVVAGQTRDGLAGRPAASDSSRNVDTTTSAFAWSLSVREDSTFHSLRDDHESLWVSVI